ncbi:hypothetical protein, partial [Hydrogenophaga taeniospiralis]|uniref:hypothetical protein n=1 Tax=Hydrogenophaga taeniospiralis TaxID=65656 RepID=UPI001C3FD057
MNGFVVVELMGGNWYEAGECGVRESSVAAVPMCRLSQVPVGAELVPDSGHNLKPLGVVYGANLANESS